MEEIELRQWIEIVCEKNEGRIKREAGRSTRTKE